MVGTYLGNGRVLVKLAYGSRLIVAGDDLSIAPHLIDDGFIEGPLTKFFISNVQPGQIAADVGANIGYFTVLLGHRVGPTGMVYAYEPDPRAFRFLIDNLQINYLSEQVKLERLAVYSSAGTLELTTSLHYLGSTSIHAFREGPSTAVDLELGNVFETIQVQSQRLDVLLASVPRIDWLKMDIEGGEYHAFLGMEGLLARRAIGTLAFEVNRLMLKGDAPAFDAFVARMIGTYNGRLYGLDAEGRPEPMELAALQKIDFYPFAVMQFPPAG